AHHGKHALIHGSSRGIGRGIALKLAGQGVKVATNYRKNEAAAKDTLAKVKQRGSDGFVIQADVCRPDDITRMFARVKSEFGKLDIFVSNARPDVAEFYQGPMNITLEQWDTAMNSQARAFLVAVRAACPLMGEGGRIVAITYAPGGRTGSWQPWVGMGAAKSAMESLCRYFAVALAKRGITVNAINPGWVQDSGANTLPDDATRRRVDVGHPRGRLREVGVAVAAENLRVLLVREPDLHLVLADLGALALEAEHQVQAWVHRGELLHPDVLEDPQHGELPRL